MSARGAGGGGGGGEELRAYRVEGVEGGVYRVRHRTTGELLSWRARACAWSPGRLAALRRDVRAVAALAGPGLVAHRSPVRHAATRTLYLAREAWPGRPLRALLAELAARGRRLRERYLWRLLHDLSAACRAAAAPGLRLTALRRALTASRVLLHESGDVKVDFFDLADDEATEEDLMRQVGRLFKDEFFTTDETKGFSYGDDLKDIVEFLADDANRDTSPDVVLYHPTVLANLELTSDSKKLSEMIVPFDFIENVGDSSKCDLEKALEVRKMLETNVTCGLAGSESPLYANVSPNKLLSISDQEINSRQTSLSPTIAALALELPGFVPRRRTIAHNAIACRNEPEQISQRTLSNQWLTRLISLREREENLNRRERDLISKEIMNSPNIKISVLNDDEDEPRCNTGITLPPLIVKNIKTEDIHPKDDIPNCWVSRRHKKRSSSVKTRRRRQSYNYGDLDSSLSADQGDGSVIITTTKFSKENMPRRNIFPEVNTKKVHFTSVNPFVESDESVTLTFYDLENVDSEGYQVPRNREYTTKNMAEEINKFKYLDLEKAALEKRAAMEQRNQCSPNKQAKFTVPANPEKKIFNDITNRAGYAIKKVPSKSSISSKTSNTSNGTKYSTASNFSSDSNKSSSSFQSCNSIRASTRLKNAEKLFTQQSKPITRQSMLPAISTETVKKPKGRKSFLPFKTPFKLFNLEMK